MRKVPFTMATQHPDSATRFVPVREEPEEAVHSLKKPTQGLGCDEYMVDYMGKLTPYHQIGQIVLRLTQEGLVPGKDVFITPRMVSDFSEEPFRQFMTLFAVLEGIYYSITSTGEQGVLEIVQAMTNTVEELVKCEERANSLFGVVESELKIPRAGKRLRIIPLFEGVSGLLSTREVVTKFAKIANIKDYLRVFLGKSETALLYGHPASALSCKVALSDCQVAAEEAGLDVYPIFGGGSLPFRGHICLENARNFLEEYKGTRTYTIQSGMRYDHGSEKTIELNEMIRSSIKNEAIRFGSDERRRIVASIMIFAKNYLQEISEITKKVMMVAQFVPDQRERILGSEEVRYYRELRNIKDLAAYCPDKNIAQVMEGLETESLKKLPRVIKFTAALYSCGLPPELIGTGNALKEIGEVQGQEWLKHLLHEIFPSLLNDIETATKYYSKGFLVTRRIEKSIENLKSFVTFRELENKYGILVKVAESYIKDLEAGKSTTPSKFAIQIAPGEVSEYLGGSVSANLGKLILDLGKLRGSLG
ncbi:MAG: phosphoenolpyruvate carboxylase [Candidatus Brockarchaeota archaeon]|nr:phosphoenolpyruvate carboxylase [Candidatus Brockarchaeota archaeon]